METLIIVFSFVLLLICAFYLAQSYVLFYFYYKFLGNGKFFKHLCEKLKGKLQREGYFAQNHEVISPLAFKNLPNRSKYNFSSCYNVIKFKTQNCNWEILSYLVKEGYSYNEMVMIRCFPEKLISQEATVERIRSHISIFSSSRHLAEVLEDKQLVSGFEWLIRKETDSLLIQHNCIVFKMFSEIKVMKEDKIMTCLKVMQRVKKEVFDKQTLKF